MYDKVETGKKLYAARKSKNLKQSDVSRVLGISQSAYSKIELGKRDMSITMLLELCDYLDISAIWLLDLDKSTSQEEALLIENFRSYLKNVSKKYK